MTSGEAAAFLGGFTKTDRRTSAVLSKDLDFHTENAGAAIMQTVGKLRRVFTRPSFVRFFEP